MSCFAPSTVRECTTVLDRTGTEARRESARDAPPTVRFYHNKWDNNKILSFFTRMGLTKPL
ncbi:MAG: hypothetical protein IJW35_00535, partial [Lentisphaeria bacterium]|nr:hypothetical protein [Lentisphaeria bacterium]